MQETDGKGKAELVPPRSLSRLRFLAHPEAKAGNFLRSMYEGRNSLSQIRFADFGVGQQGL